ncbi:PBP1 and LysM peptidoglycan-binding domain-containing protein [Robertkochia aurantiaca]|uniref:PBP1 and LysM peptidoglycan-binding domain-containing protein n=1 Tax=Robertkochia aurantiaca TaxID=2873700 RepID=UPI001CCFBC71|nr:LysM peptidoglycan-binding domain-containing protein [Robertkochia sp. 3YJGBD-33]
MKQLALTVVFSVFFSVLTYAQNFKTHAVKEGETLESIARQYSITPYNIIRLNPEAKNGVKPNTILIIPGDNQAGLSREEKQEKAAQPEPQEKKVERFINHKVRRQETLYSLAQKYDITEAEIKRYNKELYSRLPQKGEKLQIPVYEKVTAESDEIPVFGETVPYYVKPAEGTWRIAYEHGISEQRLRELNPDMNDVLQEGDTLMVPFVPGNDKKLVEKDRYNYYTIKPKEGFFRLNKKFGLTQEEIEQLNPEVKALGLQAGMIIKLPKEMTGDLKVTDGRLVEPFSLLDSINRAEPATLAVVLPFRLEKMEYDSLELAQKILDRDRLASVSLDFYTGVLVAVDSVKELGLSVKLKTFDTDGDSDRVFQILANEKLKDADAVIGPILPDAFNRLARYAAVDRIPVFAPFSNKGIDLKDNVFQTLPPDDLLRSQMISYLESHAADKNIILISDNKNVPVRNLLQTRFPGAKIIAPEEREFIRLDDINPFLSAEKENWVIVESNSVPFLSNVTGVVNSAVTDEYDIKLLTTLKGSAYESENISNMHLSNLEFRFPTVDKGSDVSNPFSRRYEKRFNTTPNRYATRGFDLAMDILLRLGYDKNLYYVASRVSETSYIENKFDYVRDMEGGFYNQAVYLVKYDDLTIKEIENDANLQSEVSGQSSNGMPTPQKR